MKKLMMFCFIILSVVLSALYCFNFAFDALDSIESDKTTIVIEKPNDINNTDFLAEIDHATEMVHADIMLRQIQITEDTTHYQYFKTNHTKDFLNGSINEYNIQLKKGECISTTEPTGYVVYEWNTSTLMQDISFYPWADAEKYDLSIATYYVRIEQQSIVTDAITQLGYTVTVNPTVYISGKFSILLFSFVPAFMLVASIIFYTLSSGKKNVLKKMEGYTTCDILFDEVKSIFPMFLLNFFIIECITILIATILYKTALLQYIIFSLPIFFVLLTVMMIGFLLSAFLIHRQKNNHYIKGKVPKQGIYITTIVSKMVFIGFLIFFLSIAIRNAAISYYTMQTSQFFADKLEGYITLSIYTNNIPTQNLTENYKAFYAATVNRYHGILIDASNYEYSLIRGVTPAEEFGQTYIVVNRNYLEFNPIYDTTGTQITNAQLSNSRFNVLLPASKEQEKQYWYEFVQNAYGMESNFISYDEVNSKIYSYHADTRMGNYGELQQPIILMIEQEQIEGAFMLNYCTNGAYFLYIPENAYEELLPILQETGIDSVTLETPSVSSTFLETINHQQKMLLLYGIQSIILLIGLFFLIIFGVKLYCENYNKKIACCFIEGYSMQHCMRKHMIVTFLCYTVIMIVLLFFNIVVSLNYLLLLLIFMIELTITIIVSRKYTKNNMYHIIKGEE